MSEGIKNNPISILLVEDNPGDVADALISERPYRQAWSVEKTYGYIESQRGIYFAPEVVDAFLDMKWK